MRLLARTPATVANLGPGFDALALAVDVENEVEVDTEARPAVVVEGEGAGELPEDASNLVFRSMAYLAREAGGSLPPFRLRCRNAIPLERGLGSSSSATVAGLLLANELIGSRLDPPGLLQVAVDIEGHPDNVAACILGGLVVAYLSATGWRAEPLEPHASLRPVLLVPEEERVPTADARRILPREVPLSAAAHNVGRAALTVVALTARPELLLEALEDRLHQARRLALAPASRALFQDLRDAGLAVCVAGAGPSLLAFETDSAVVPELGPGWRVLRPRIAPGAELRRL
ncbi:MAG TPA: homoserine kinase [Actinomycetota bacterium]|jgi:homoserine kinase|nr:homoserine kinase [Actinomycetota bacterium]